MNRSPDITEGTTTTTSRPPVTRRGRKKANQAAGSSLNSSVPVLEQINPAGGQEEDSEIFEGPPPPLEEEVLVDQMPAKRRPGRPKKNPNGGAAPPPPKASGGGKRGRKPKNASQPQTQSEEVPVPDDNKMEVEVDNNTLAESVDEIEANVKAISLFSTHEKEMKDSDVGLEVKTNVEKDLGTQTSVEAIFMVKEEKQYGRNFIPGLDLAEHEEVDTENSTTTLLEKIKVANALVPEKMDDSKPVQDEEIDGEETKIRRSSRIKSLENQRGSRGRRREVVFSSSMESMSSSRSMPNLTEDDSNSSEKQGGTDSPRDFSGVGNSSSCGNLSAAGNIGVTASIPKPLKVKSRWRYSSDAESMRSDGLSTYDSESMLSSETSIFDSTNSVDKINQVDSESEETPIVTSFVKPSNLLRRPGYLTFSPDDTELIEKLKKFQGIEESIFKTERKISKESKGMVCDCFLTPEDFERGEVGCNEDCLNRLLMVECGARCPTGEMCANKKFQKKEYASLEVFKTDKKGHGLRTLEPIPEGGFVIEYVGEVLDPWQFEQRTKDYARGNQEHFYFMALKSDAIIDATGKGNCSRFINHSCEPNCETQKWTVNGELRIGFFTLRDLRPGEEIVFDYQFQRYGKKAQKCYCMTPSCRGWIGEEDEDEDREDIGEIEGEASEISEGVEREKVKRKPRGPRKKRIDTRILEDVALEEELTQLERSGLKNRTHTLTLSRLMVRAEKWDDRERILNILINGDSPCRRLFLDYRGLKLLYNWMVNLPLPSNECKEQLIRNEEYHKLFLKALQSLPIPNKTMLLDSKMLSLIEVWSAAPHATEIIEQLPVPIAKTEATAVTEDPTTSKSENPPELVKNETGDVLDVSFKAEQTDSSSIPMEITENEPKFTETSGEDLQMTTVVTEITWKFVDTSKSLLESWKELKEVFRIPKKERVEQMKEHEREADIASTVNADSDSAFSSRYSYDKDRDRHKWIGSRTTNRDRDRRSLQESFGGHRRMMMYPNMSKEERRSMFAARVAQEEEDMKQRKMQEEIVSLHQHRCGLLGLDPCTTPVVDVSGHYYLDPKTIEWRLIDPLDPMLPKELLMLVNAAQEPPVVEPITTGPAEIEFPPWPEGLPPPPPLPPAVLPNGWKLAVDDEGRCYYYHVKSRQSQWHPPMEEDYVAAESTDSSDSELENETSKENEPPVVPRPILTLRTKLMERAARRKKSGLVQERIISPRTDEDKSLISKAVIRARKLEVLEEKKQKIADEKAKLQNKEGRSQPQDVSPNDGNSTDEISQPQTDENSESVESVEDENNSNKKRKVEPKDDKENPVSRNDEDDDGSESPMNTSPIETELDISLAAAEDNDNLDIFTNDLEQQGSQDLSNLGKIPGLGFDPRDRASSSSSSAKKDRSAKVDKKQKALAYKKIAADKRQDTFRNQIANVVVTHLNPYRKPDCKSGRIVSTEDFKHLARKMTHAIFLKELKNAREGKPLEVTDSVKHKTKEYIKKYMGRFGSSHYLRSPEDSQDKKD